MEKTDDGIFIPFKEIENLSKTVGYIALTVFTARVIGYLFMPMSYRIDV